jgi:hypothetical protein
MHQDAACVGRCSRAMQNYLMQSGDVAPACHMAVTPILQVSCLQKGRCSMAGKATAAMVRHATQADLTGMVAIVAACGLDWTRDSLQVEALLTALSCKPQASWACHIADLVHLCDGCKGMSLQEEIKKDYAKVLVVESRDLLCAMLVAWLVADEVCTTLPRRLQC